MISPRSQFRTVLPWDGLIELLADKGAGSRTDADCDIAVSCWLMVFDVGDEGWGNAYAIDERISMPDAAVSLIIDCRRGCLSGGRLGDWHVWSLNEGGEV